MSEEGNENIEDQLKFFFKENKGGRENINFFANLT
jgi:hypothetical protein